MSQDYEVTKKIWDSKIPIEFVLESDDIPDQPKPFYAMLSRVSYFPLIFPKIVAYFSSVGGIQLELDKIWLEYSKTPIKTYYPIGALFDMLKTDDLLPWTISVRTKEPPACAVNVGKDTMESMFMQSVKEADHLRRRGEVMNAMRSEEHKQLWKGLVFDNFEDYWTINKRLVDGCGDSSRVTNLPIRLYQNGCPIRQVPLPPSKPSGEPNTLSDALPVLDPSLDLSQSIIISHGIELPLDTPLSWLAINVSYPDNFVHLVSVPKK